MTNEQQIDEILNRGVANIIPNREELKKALLSGKGLNIYLGIDPTSTHIHLGHAVPLRKLQSLVELGHHVTFLIGDFTALIGDSSDKESERPVLTKEEIKSNFLTYKAQAEKIIDFSKVKVGYNSTWLSKLSYEDVIKLFHHFSLNDFASRELIKKRLDAGTHISLAEMAYPVMQGYDSYFMDTDLQIGGTDQTFNMQAGRILQKDLRNKESFVLTTTFLEGTDGRKMSKTWGNAIWLDDNPDQIYGKTMSLKDELLIQYFTLATELDMAAVGEIERRLKTGENPMKLKKELAFELVMELYGEEAARESQTTFENTFQKGGTPTEIPTLSLKNVSTVNPELVKILVAGKAVPSLSEAKRLIFGGAVEVDSKVILDPSHLVKPSTIKIGKRRFLKVTT